ncbi:uncharacterized protein EAF01_008402 [Botrytis porri]|uniref:ABC transporter domain-containing protein n=1 Tax=Botrytis porri TaxID=87229 RepID=A0A4Z1KX94_9HELO|nr:uncharacterized protein EAF01_008402 [Botrytis porri]KAF7899189.1 hypothetical protein EAF01_008402 [Botrytis porri]TGO89219.1 hypothetical protein BPOR_0119g00060 [Botrytis porri]
MVAMRRHYQLIWGARRSLAIILTLNAVNALITGSAFYERPLTATGVFELSGAVFFAQIYFCLNASGEIVSTVHSRTILQKQHTVGELHPAVLAVALNIAELLVFFRADRSFHPSILLSRLCKSNSIRILGFQLLIFVFYTSQLAFFRMLGAWSPNVPVALLLGGAAMPVGLSHSGYGPTWPAPLKWDFWIRRISPSPYSLEATMGFLMKDNTNITLANQGCPISGSSPGSSTVIYTGITAVGLTLMTKNRDGGGASRVFKQGAVIPDAIRGDEELREKEIDLESQGNPAAVHPQGMSRYVRPGQLTALMGVFGAGKATLIDTLTQRKDTGIVTGDMMIGGATVREAVIFSAMMRRPLSVSKKEKEARVEEVMDLLGLESIADALIGVPGEGGLGVEERKQVTIGVELAASPSMLLFLDEPTSGLDSQAAYSLVMCLQLIAASGVPIIWEDALYYSAKPVVSNLSIVVDYFARNGTTMDGTANPAEFMLDTVASPSGSDEWSRTWNDSPERHNLQTQIEHLNSSVNSNLDASTIDEILPLIHQYITLTSRHWLPIWRNGVYSFSRLAKAIFMGLFLSFIFYQASDTEQGTQNRLIALLLLPWLIPAPADDIQAIWYSKWALYTARERSGVGYHSLALFAALVTVEIPLAIVIYTIYFLCSWFTIGLEEPAFGYLLFLALGIYGLGFSLAMAALVPNSEVAGFANSLLWCVHTTFGGMALTYSDMPSLYSAWLFWADPLRYWLGSAISNGVHSVPIICSASEITIVSPPVGQIYGRYLATYLSGTGIDDASMGYISNPNATENSSYRLYQVGDDYAVSFSYLNSEKVRDLGIFTLFSILAIVFLASWGRFSNLKGPSLKGLGLGKKTI